MSWVTAFEGRPTKGRGANPSTQQTSWLFGGPRSGRAAATIRSGFAQVHLPGKTGSDQGREAFLRIDGRALAESHRRGPGSRSMLLPARARDASSFRRHLARHSSATWNAFPRREVDTVFAACFRLRLARAAMIAFGRPVQAFSDLGACATVLVYLDVDFHDDRPRRGSARPATSPPSASSEPDLYGSKPKAMNRLYVARADAHRAPARSRITGSRGSRARAERVEVALARGRSPQGVDVKGVMGSTEPMGSTRTGRGSPRLSAERSQESQTRREPRDRGAPASRPRRTRWRTRSTTRWATWARPGRLHIAPVEAEPADRLGRPPRAGRRT